MMRTTLLFLIGLGLTLPLLAQDLPEGPSELNIQIEETAPSGIGTNKTAAASSTGQGVALPLTDQDIPKEPSRLNIQVEDAPPSGSGTKEATAAATNQVVDTKLSFLMDTGIQYADEGEYAEAERAYLRALEAAPDAAGIRFRLSTLYIMMERYTEAVSILEALISEYPDNSQTRNNLAWCYATGKGVKNKKLALRHAREALLLAPLFPSVWNTLAEAYYVAGDYERALRSSDHAIDLLIQIDPNQTGLEEFKLQRQKILRAQQAVKRFEGLDDDE